MKKFPEWITNPITWIVGAAVAVVGVIVWAIIRKK